ncbi:hypothetical protein MTO96_017823 [Rhipicephalus appendiculatus]
MLTASLMVLDASPFTEVRIVNGVERWQKPKGGMGTGCDWNSPGGAAVQATDEQRVRQIIQDSLRGQTLRQTDPGAQAAVIEKASATPNLNQLPTAAEASARQDPVAAEPYGCTGAPGSAVIERTRDAADTVTTAGQDSAAEECRRPSRRWTSNLNVRDLAAKLVAQQPEHPKQTTVVEPAKNPLADSFVTIRGVKLHSPLAVSPPRVEPVTVVVILHSQKTVLSLYMPILFLRARARNKV